MVSRVRSLGIKGIGGYEVSVECSTAQGLPDFSIVGLPDAAARAHLIRAAFSKNPSLLQGSDLTQEMLVSRLDGYSCADIAAVCEKMKARALERALEKAEHGKGEVEPVTRADADSVLQVYRNSVTQESLQAFRAFSEGVI